MANEELSLEPEAQGGDLSLSSGGAPSLAPNASVASARAMKAHIALGELSPGYDVLQSGIQGGDEISLRQQAAGREVERAIKDKPRLLGEIAQKMGSKITPRDREVIQSIAMSTPTSNPDTVFERNFGRSYTSIIAAQTQETTDAAMKENPVEAHKTLDAASALATKQEIFRKGVEDLEMDVKQQSWGINILNTAEQMIPFVTSYRLHNAVVPGSILTGSNLEEQVQALWALPPDEAKKRYDAAIAEIKSHNNPLDALLFAKAVQNFTDQDRIGGNLMNIADSTMLAAPAMKALKLTSNQIFRGVMRDAVKGNSGNNLTDTLTVIGKTEEAAQLKATKLLQDTPDPLQLGHDLRETVPSLFNPSKLGLNPGANSTEMSQRIIGRLTQSAERLNETIQSAPRVNRLQDSKLQEGLNDATARAKLEFPSVNDGIIDVRHVHVPETNVDYAVLRVGKKGETILSEAGGTPSPAKGTVRFYHGGDEPTSGGSRFITPHEDYARNFRAAGTPKAVHYVDIPEKELKTNPKFAAGYDEVNGYYRHFEAPEDVAKGLKPLRTIKGLDHWEAVTILGRRDATLFKSPGTAQTYAEKVYGLTDANRYTIVQEGKGWYLSIPTAIHETGDAVRAVPLATNNTNNTSIMNALLGYIRSSADSVAPFQRQNRMIAQHAPNEIQKALEEVANNGLNLSNKGKSELNRVLEYQRDFEDYSKPMSRGKYSNGFEDLQRDWKKVHGKLPTEEQQLAYFQVRQLNDMDWVIRNYNYHRDAAIRGSEHISIPMPDGAGKTRPFMGRVLDDFPWQKAEDAGILWHENGSWKPWQLQSDFTQAERTLKRAEIKAKNLHVIQVWNPDDRPLSQYFGKDPVHYIITDDVNRVPLPHKLIDYNPGGHVIYPNQWKTVQPIIEKGRKGRDWFYGDKVITGHETEVQSRAAAKNMEELRQLMKAGKVPEAEAFAAKNFPEDMDIIGKFAKGYLSIDHPIVHIPFGPSATSLNSHAHLREMYPDTKLWNLVNSGHNPSLGVDKSFMAERNGPLQTITNVGSKHAPMYELQTARVLDPLMATQRGLSNSVHRGMYMNDYKQSAVEQWVQQYWPIMNVPGGKAEIMKNPGYYFHNPNYVPSNAQNFSVLKNAENARRGVRNFLGVQSDLNKDISIVQEKVANLVYSNLGDKATNWYASHTLSMLKEPSDYIRGVNVFLNFAFSPVQFLVQGISATHSLAVSPLHGLQGMAGAMAQRMMFATENPKIWKAIANKVPGWEAEHLLESYNAARNSGWYRIGGEVAWRDSVQEPRIMQTVGDKLTNIGMYPFREGDRLARMTAWNTAYHEWRAANPTAQLDNRMTGELLLRAQTLSVDMTREANSAVQKGPLSIPLQFQSFSMRFAEQFMGDRLTGKEKASAMMIYGALFGVPITLSATGIPKVLPGGVWPYYESLKSYMMENYGHEVLDTEGWKLFNEGIVGRITAWATGKEYDVSHRLGPNSSDTMKVILETLYGGDTGKTPLEIMMGPTGSTIERVAKNSLPLYAGLRAAMRGGQETFPLTNDDAINIAKDFSVARQGYNAFMAWNYQKYVASNASIVANDMSKTDAVMSALGFTRMDIQDSRIMQSSMRDQKKYQDWVGLQVLEQYKRAWVAGGQNDWVEMERYMTRAKTFSTVFGDLNERQQFELQKRSMTAGMIPTIDKINQDFHNPDKAPKSQALRRFMKHFGIENAQ